MLRVMVGEGRNAVLVAPPGAGKTTLVPLALMQAGKRTLILMGRVNRRPAAWAIRVALAEALGAPKLAAPDPGPRPAPATGKITPEQLGWVMV